MCICSAANPLRTFLSACDPVSFIMHNVNETEKAHLIAWKECFNKYAGLLIFSNGFEMIKTELIFSEFYLGKH